MNKSLISQKMTQNIKRKRTRQLLIDTGFTLINTYGYHAISIDRILQELEITKGAFYYHFKNKHQFVEAIIQDRLRPEITATYITPINQRGNPKFILGDLLEEQFINNKRLNTNEGSALSNFMVALSNEENDYDLQGQLKAIYDEWKVALINLLYRGIEDGFLHRHIDTEAVAEYIIYSLEGARTMQRVNAGSGFYNFIAQFKEYMDSMKKVDSNGQISRYKLVS
ncbi:TetR/AcrR family transcriptional regulator [Flavobacteriaceae bacterium F08102]|nr:TetR/AcrR family transcriptional regulator [Flavobacteriaceae bacterium F08102]